MSHCFVVSSLYFFLSFKYLNLYCGKWKCVHTFKLRSHQQILVSSAIFMGIYKLLTLILDSVQWWGLAFCLENISNFFPSLLWGLLFILYWKKPIVRSFCILYWFCDRVPKKGGLPIPRESHLAIRRLSIMLARWCTQKATCMMAANQCNATGPFAESHKWHFQKVVRYGWKLS